MKRIATIGLSVLASAALVEALLPGIVVGGALVLAPKYLPRLRRGLQPLFAATGRSRTAPRRPQPNRGKATEPLATVPRLAIKQAVAKTITFRIVVSTLDFTVNYVVIGELATAAGLSAIALVGGPLFYFLHETGWNYVAHSRTTIEVPALLPIRRGGGQGQGKGITISRALAKTITFRTLATLIDFTTNYVVVRDLATAAGLSAFAFVVGPFVYIAHEKAWDHYAASRDDTPPQPLALLPSPGPALQ